MPRPADDPARATHGPVVRARDVSRRYGAGEAAVEALRGVSVDLERGRLTAITGPSGSGKSTLLHVLAGLDRPSGGSIELDGVELTRLGDAGLTRLRRDRVGFVFQAFNLLPVLSVEENVLLPLSIAGRRPDRAWFAELVARLGIGDRLAEQPSRLSGGQQQRVAIARALIARPAVVFADEPTGNLDSAASGDVLRLLREAVDALGQTVVVATHDPLAVATADKAVELADGRVAACAP